MRKLDAILCREVTRKQFLGLMGLGLLSMFGLSAVMGLFAKTDNTENNLRDYGIGAYGP